MSQANVQMSSGSRQGAALCVDLDGTLIHTNLLLELFLALIKTSPLTIFRIPGWLFRGKAYLKEQIAKRVTLDMSSLPYNQELLSFLHAEKAAGRKIVLATASHKLLADKTAEHLGIFSDVFATENGTNLSGVHKSTRLVGELGARNFDYAANDTADLPVWRQARKIILVNAEPGLERKARDLGEIDKIFVKPKPSLKQYIRALRPHQWAKNLLVCIPALAAHSVMNAEIMFATLLAFVSFSLCASSVYVANDMFDLEADRGHAKKRLRPFASGAVPLGHGMVMAPVLLAASFAIALLLPLWFSIILAGYFLTTVAYTLDLKRRTIVDVLTLAILYTYRLLAGGAATGIDLSTWLLALALFLFLSLALVKRYSELHALAAAGDDKVKGRGYRVTDLPLIESLGTSSGYLAVLVLALYISSPDVRLYYSTPAILWGLCILLLYWISRTWMLTHRGKMHQDPVVFALTDRISLLVGVLSATLIGMATMNLDFIVPFR